jgi:CDP-diglyceride synthetase
MSWKEQVFLMFLYSVYLNPIYNTSHLEKKRTQFNAIIYLFQPIQKVGLFVIVFSRNREFGFIIAFFIALFLMIPDTLAVFIKADIF